MLKIKYKFRCIINHAYVCDYKYNNNQFFNLSLFYKNCIKIYINDTRVPKRDNYLVSTYKNTNSIKVKLIGLLNNHELYIDINSKSLDVCLKSFKKETLNIKAINRLSHRSFNLNSSSKEFSLKSIMLEKKVNNTDFELKDKSPKFIKEKYSLTKLINQYEQTNLSNT